MLRRWTTTRSWLVTWELLAIVWFGVAANRYQRTSAIVTPDVGVTPMAWALLMDLIVAAALSAACAVVGVVPAAWKVLGLSRGDAELSRSVSADLTRDRVGRPLSE